MTYLDASVIVAILGREDDAELLLNRLEAAQAPFLISLPGLFEAVMSLAAKKARDTGRELDSSLIDQAQNSVSLFAANIKAREIEISPAIGRAAIEAAKRYGRAVGSPAKLNFGDCFAYACAKEHGAILLYKGNDFAKTDMA